MSRRACAPVLVALAVSALPCQAQTAEERRNWFDDPFFQVTTAIADCPLPAGPFTTEAERRLQAHHRAERGTTCWLAGQCDRPNDYAYDQDIAAAFRLAWAQHPPDVGATTLWVTVQGRVIYIEGCAAREAATPALEAFAGPLPNVRQAIANLRTRPAERAPYQLRSAP
jgi:hypothetical protein